MFLGSREQNPFPALSRICDGQKQGFLRIIFPCASWRTLSLTYSWEPGQSTPPPSMQPRSLAGHARILWRGVGCVSCPRIENF